MKLLFTFYVAVTLCYVTSSLPQNHDLDDKVEPVLDVEELKASNATEEHLPGFPKNCCCEPSEINQLKSELETLQRSVAELTEIQYTTTLYYEQICYAGIQNHRIPDSAMTASSFYNYGYQACYGRLDNTGDPGGYWHSQKDHFDNQWLQVDFGTPKRIVGVITQGRTVNYEEWVTSYKILYGNIYPKLVSIKDNNSQEDLVFQGNRDRNSKVTNMFPQPIIARYFRLLVVGYNGYPVLRIEYLTC